MIDLTSRVVPARDDSALPTDYNDDGVKTCDGEDLMRVEFARKGRMMEVNLNSRDRDGSKEIKK